MEASEANRIHVETVLHDSASGPGAAVTKVSVEPPDPAYETELTISYTVTPADVVAWLERHGHRGWYAGHAPGADADTVVMFDHGPGTEARAAMPGDTLTVRKNGSIIISGPEEPTEDSH